MKNLVIISAVGLGVFMLIRSVKTAAAAVAPATGRRVYTTSGDLFTLKEGKDGTILDGIGGTWV